MSLLDQDNDDNNSSNDNSNQVDKEDKPNRTDADIKSERNKKRLEQMRKRKEAAGFDDEEDAEEKKEKGLQCQEMEVKENDRLFNAFQDVSKRFQSEDSFELNSYKNPQPGNKEELGSVLSESLEEGNRNDIEVIISDLECDLSNENDLNDNCLVNSNPNQFNKLNSLIYCATSNPKKSFIQLNNQLKNSLEASSITGKGTLSYMMALGEIAPEQKQSYTVENVIEEEPENCIEGEPERNKRDTKKSACFIVNHSNAYQNTMSIQTLTNCFHKGSKSELLNIHSVIQSIQILLEKRMDIQSIRRLKKILQMKSVLVETFKRPSSFNDFVYNNSLAICNNKDSYSSLNKRSKLPLSVDLNAIESKSLSDEEEDERVSLLNESKNSLLEVKDTNVNFEQELNLQMEKNNMPTEEIEKGLNESSMLFPSTKLVRPNPVTSSWNTVKQNKKQKVKAISYEISSAIKVEIVNQEKGPKQHKQSSSKVAFTNNYINNNINNISINIFPMKQQTTSPKLTFNRLHHSSITSYTHDIRKQLLISQGKAQSVFLNKSTLGEELNYTSHKKKSLPVNQLLTYSSTVGNAPMRQRTSNIKHCLTYNNTHNEANTCQSYINFITEHPLPLSDIMIRIPTEITQGNKKVVREGIKYLSFPFSSLDHQKFAIDRLVKSGSNSFCLCIQKNALKAKTYEFKALYEMNTARGVLSKIYSIALFPFTVEYYEAKYIYKFDSVQKSFHSLHLNDYKTFSSNIHCFTLSTAKKI